MHKVDFVRRMAADVEALLEGLTSGERAATLALLISDHLYRYPASTDIFFATVARLINAANEADIDEVREDFNAWKRDHGY